MMGRRNGWMTAWLVFAGLGTSVEAQSLRWDTFDDPLSPSECSIVNAANTELVVMRSTGQLVIVTGSQDIILEDTLVDDDGDVFFEGVPAGLIAFAEDGDGFRTLWWTGLTGRVVEVDDFTFEPNATDLLPEDFSDVGCDACDFRPDNVDCVVPPVIRFNLCGLGGSVSMIGSLAGLLVLGLIRRR